MWSRPPSTEPNAHPQNEEYCSVAIHNPLTGYEPNQLDTLNRRTQALSSPLFIQEREEPANLRLVTLMKKVCCQTKFRFVSKAEIKSRPGKRATQDSPWKNKKQILAEVNPEARISSRFWQKKYPGIDWNYWVSAKRIDHTIRGCDQSRRDQLLLQEELSEQKSGSSWNSYQEYARHGRIAEKSRVKGRGTAKKKIDWIPKHYYGAKSPNSGITEWSQLYEWLERF